LFATSIERSGRRASGGTARTELANSSTDRGDVFMVCGSRRPDTSQAPLRDRDLEQERYA
jgi:hypothetical protein